MKSLVGVRRAVLHVLRELGFLPPSALPPKPKPDLRVIPTSDQNGEH